MRARPRMVVIALGLALVISGCAGTSRQGSGVSAHNSGANASCTWTFERSPNGNVIASTVVAKEKAGVPAGSCKVQEVKSFSVTNKDKGSTAELLEVGPQGFVAGKDVALGSCQWCYWTGGGWVCIYYPC